MPYLLPGTFVDGSTTVPVGASNLNEIVAAVTDLDTRVTTTTTTANAAVPKTTATSKGDLLVATASGVITRIGIGADAQVLTADSTTGTGIKWGPPTSGGSGIPASTVTAKADLIVATANATVSRLGVGTDGQVLTAASAQATGLTWATPTGGGGGVPTSRLINTSTGLSGGGDLTADRTLSVVTDTTVQRLEIASAGSVVGTRKRLNFIPGANISYTFNDDTPNNKVDVTVTANTTILNAGSSLTARPTIDFTGTGVISSDDSGNNKTIVKIPGQNGIPTPESQNLAAWAFDPGTNTTQAQPVAGTIYLIKMLTPPRGQASIGTVYWYISTTFAGPVSGQNQIGLYSSTGTQLDTPASVDAEMTTNGLKTTTFSGTAGVPSTSSFMWVAFLFNATTMGNIVRGTGVTGLANVGLTAATYRYAINGTGATTLPSTITPSANTSNAQAFWAAIGV